MIDAPPRPPLGAPRWLIDWAPVAVLPPVLVADALLSDAGRPLTVVNVLVAIAVCVPLAWRCRIGLAPMVGLIVAGVVLVMWQLHPGNTVVLIPMVAVFELARRFDRRRALWIAAVCVPGVLAGVLPFTSGFDETFGRVVRNLVLCLVAVAAGDMVRSRREASERAADLRESETVQRVTDERLRIAREIHDVVAHAMTAINVQAGVAAHLLERDPGQAHGALRDIKRVSGDALTELRATLAVLREPGSGVPLAPAGGLADLERLAGDLRGAGVSVAVDAGSLGDVPPAVDHAGYRIVQEALTNVARHAQASHARVTVGRDDGTLAIEVADDGRACADATVVAGNGLRGMRERAQALGGSLHAAPGPEGGFAVRARLPVSGAPGDGPSS